MISITIESLYGVTDYYDLDSDSSTITGLIPRPLTFSASPVSTMFVNSKIALRFDFTLPDTIDVNDYFRIYFPSVTNFANQTATSLTSNFTLNTATIYDNANKMLEIKQRNTSTSVFFASRMLSISVLLFTSPPSIKLFSLKF